MSIKIYTSSSVETLAKEFAQLYVSNSTLFVPMLVVIGANSTKDWLKETTAKNKGIVANLSFKNPKDSIEFISKIVGINEISSNSIQPIQLNWIIYSVLGSEEFNISFPDIAVYFKANDLKRITLAEKVASIFDKYQSLNSSVISPWNNLDYTPINSDEIWQCYIWKKVIEKTNGGVSDLSQTIDRISNALLNDSHIALLKSKLPSITFFGQMEYSKEVLSLLKVLSNHIKVSVFRIDYRFLGSKENQNRLVRNFGKFIVSQNELFAEENLETKQLENLESFKTNLLGALKSSVFQKAAVIKQSIDDSITINNCFTINREVEILYHYLIKQFEENPSLGARDICVMMPNPEEYAAAIHAFFASSKYEIKYTLSDTNLNIEESPYAAFLALLELDKDNFTSEEVLKLLDYNYLRTKFDFSEDLSTVRRAVHLANIKLGIDGNPELETNLVSWRYGLKRLMYGICIKNERELFHIEGDDFYTVNQFEGEAANDIIRLNYYVEQVIHFISNRNDAKTLKEWLEFTEQSVDTFLDTTEFDFTFFYNNIGKIDEISSYLEGELIPFSVFKHYLEAVLKGMESGSKTGFSGIRFSSLQPLMSAPAKIIAFLGINNGDFPRKQNPLSFDLAQEVRTQADLDKQLFLNSILGAQEKIYISYIGQSVNDNSSIPPSTVVDELIAAIEPLLVTNEGCNLITKHPLHSFSTLYNNQQNLTRYFSKDIPENIRKEKDDQETVAFSKEIQLNDLYRFLSDPIKWYYNKTLGIYYNEEDATLAETELFSLNHLEKWIIKDEVLNIPDFDKNHLEALRTEKVKRGTLPLSNSGALVLQKTFEEVEQLKVLFEEVSKGEVSNEHIEYLQIGNYFLSGQINSIYDTNFAFGTVSKDKYKYRLLAFIQYLALVASGKETMELCYFHIESNCKKVVSGISIVEAKEILERWCGYFEMGQNRILAFTLDFSKFKGTDNQYSFFTGLIEKHKTGENILEEMKTKVNSFRNPSFGDCYLSDYQKKEIDNNFFDKVETVSEFLNIYEDIIVKLNKYFN